MARLYRPPIPVAVKVAVARRQAAERPSLRFGHHVAVDWTGHAGLELKSLLGILAANFGCGVSDLRLDHDPPLGARPKTGEGKATVYDPPANDPEHLKYRPHGAQFDGSHDVKTRIRGEHGQFSDVALIKRERRRQRREKPPTAHQAKMAELKERQRKLRKEARKAARKAGKAVKSRWPSRPFRSKKSPHRFGGADA